MAKKTQRKKPGFTRSGEVKIVSLSYKQLHDMLEKTSKKKSKAKIHRRMTILKNRPGFINPIVALEPTE